MSVMIMMVTKVDVRHAAPGDWEADVTFGIPGQEEPNDPMLTLKSGEGFELPPKVGDLLRVMTPKILGPVSAAADEAFFGVWVGVEEFLPLCMESVLVWGELDGEDQPDCHEGYLQSDRRGLLRWDSVREDDGVRMSIGRVTHWMKRPGAPLGSGN